MTSLAPHYRDGHEMARTLVQYMSDAKAIRREIAQRFDNAPSVKTIAAYRGAWLNKPPAPKVRPTDTIPTQEQIELAKGVDALLKAIQTGSGPDGLAWKTPSPTMWQPEEVRGYQYRTMDARIERVREKEARADELRVDRDPMPCCGVRADLHDEWGCRR